MIIRSIKPTPINTAFMQIPTIPKAPPSFSTVLGDSNCRAFALFTLDIIPNTNPTMLSDMATITPIIILIRGGSPRWIIIENKKVLKPTIQLATAKPIDTIANTKHFFEFGPTPTEVIGFCTIN